MRKDCGEGGFGQDAPIMTVSTSGRQEIAADYGASGLKSLNLQLKLQVFQELLLPASKS